MSEQIGILESADAGEVVELREFFGGVRGRCIQISQSWFDGSGFIQLTEAEAIELSQKLKAWTEYP